MGEARYYLKIKGEAEAIEKAYPEIKALFSEGIKAQDWWQKNRDRDKEEREGFWKDFESRFPLTSEYLKSFEARDFNFKENKWMETPAWGNDCNNALAGLLDFGNDEEDLENFNTNETEIRYDATVWHFAKWDPLSNFITLKWGLDMTWLSDEYVDLYDLL